MGPDLSSSAARTYTDDVMPLVISERLLDWPNDDIPASRTPTEQLAWCLFLGRLEGVEVEFE